MNLPRMGFLFASVAGKREVEEGKRTGRRQQEKDHGESPSPARPADLNRPDDIQNRTNGRNHPWQNKPTGHTSRFEKRNQLKHRDPTENPVENTSQIGRASCRERV